MDINKIKDLRARTGAGVMDCKNALIETKEDIEKAVEYLRKKGIVSAEKRAGRPTEQGIIISYIHPGARLGVLLELSSETDFTANTPDFKTLAKDVAMQVAACNPKYISKDDVPEKEIEKEIEIYKAQAKEQGKPEKILNKIAQGKLKNFYKEVCLLDQPFIKQDQITIEELIKEHIAKLKENIQVKNFSRFEIGV